MGNSRRRAGGRGPLPGAAVVAAAYLAGSVPFSNLMARARLGVDLRQVGTGTVSGSALYHQAGFGPLAVAGVAEVAKGAVGPVLAGRDRPVLAAAATAGGIAGHDWSPWLGGAGGRGFSPALGALLIRDRPGVALLLAALVVGGVTDQEGAAVFVAALALPAVLGRTRGRDGAVLGAAITATMLAKRLAGNRPPERRDLATWSARLVLDRDGWTVEAGDADDGGADDRARATAAATDTAPVTRAAAP